MGRVHGIEHRFVAPLGFTGCGKRGFHRIQK